MQNDCTTVDRLIEEISDYNSGYQEAAVAKLKQLCSQSYDAYAYLYVRMLNESLPSDTERRLGDVLMTVRTHAPLFDECRQVKQTSLSGRNFLSETSRRS